MSKSTSYFGRLIGHRLQPKFINKTTTQMAQWVIDGVGDLLSIRRRVQRATAIILLDLPLWVHFWRAAERQMAWADGTLEYPPAGGKVMPPTKRLFEMIAQVDRDWMPILRDICDEQESLGKLVTRLRTIEEQDAYVLKG